ncbi:GNAT family N-acetyltransferase [Halorarius halobius]|uniref:GNAT family N-acetyltransferase n=1 Tax=Halorarius halobius TaxID=2962671 RepID=UPI0020CD24B1|nr:GNAT family N-acetyltransferase [Halorarius halobius]
MTTVRPYRSADDDALWRLKAAFERELGATGDDAKASAYDDKLTDDYRRRWLDWVDRCTGDEDCIFVAPGDEGLAGYVFLLPERLAFVWDAAVVNEVFVRPAQRGTGVADALLERALDHAREQALPLDRVVLDVDRENERARAFYERHGFEGWGEMVARDL